MTDPYLTVLDDLGKPEMAVVRWNMASFDGRALLTQRSVYRFARIGEYAALSGAT